jgi:hypothetical protein
MKAFKYYITAIHTWKTPITEQHLSNHKTLDSAKRELKRYESKNNGNKYRIDEH